MCGIAGYLSFNSPTDDTRTLLCMSRAIAHRGPDDEGFVLIDPARDWVMDLYSSQTASAARGGGVAIESVGDQPHRIGLAHRRFSIVDLSSAGHQPFWSTDRRVVAVFNGEIYNYVELRSELERLGHVFRTRSDTEVLLAGYQQWGEACFKHFTGFWAVALYDCAKRQLLLARDRLGKAPLYFTRRGGRLWFASEIKAILVAAGRSGLTINEKALADYALMGRRDVMHSTMYEGIETLPAASYAWVAGDGTFVPQRYWSIPTRRFSEREMPVAAAVENFREALGDALELRLRADAPVGLELSGGLDSSTMVALTAARGKPLRAFTASFAGDNMDEAPFARQVVEHCNANIGGGGSIEMTTIRPTGDEFWDHADSFLHLMDEPIHAPNTLTYQRVWAAMASHGLRASISGAAADELLAGYHRDYYTPYLRHLMHRGQFVQLHREIAHLSERPAAFMSAEYRKRWRQAMGPASSAAASAAGVLNVSSPGSAVHQLDASLSPLRLPKPPRDMPGSDIDSVLHANMTDWRMNYWLRVANTSSMGVPLEIRMPFLDHRVVELGFTMPLAYLIRDGWMKWIMRKAMDGLLPPDIIWRQRKWGFRFPYTQWLRESEQRFFTLASGVDCPYIDAANLRTNYATLAEKNPLLLWRAMNIVLWWKRSVMDQTLG